MRRSPSPRLAETLSARKAERKAHVERMAALHATAKAIVATGHCPECGTPLRRNLSIAGWWQCDALGVPAFRRPEHRNLPECSFQTFTE